MFSVFIAYIFIIALLLTVFVLASFLLTYFPITFIKIVILFDFIFRIERFLGYSCFTDYSLHIGVSCVLSEDISQCLPG